MLRAGNYSQADHGTNSFVVERLTNELKRGKHQMQQPRTEHQSGRLDEVVYHWLPRMQAVGLSFTDVRRLIAESEDWSEWCQVWTREGEAQYLQGQHFESQGRLVTAGESYSRAALFFHFAQFMFFDDLSQKQVASERKISAYLKAAPYLSPPAAPLKIPYNGQYLPGFLRIANTSNGSLVIIVPGSDSTKEEEGALEEVFLKRGLSTLTFDGPGQGEGRSFGPLTPDWAPVLRAVVDHVLERGWSTKHIALFGMAFGGQLVLQGAHAAPEIGAIVCMNGFYDFAQFWDQLPPVYRANMGYALGGTSPEETAMAARKFSLRRQKSPECPILVVHGGEDEIFPPSEAKCLAEWANKVDLVIYPQGNHVCNNMAYRYRSLSADWLSEQIGHDMMQDKGHNQGEPNA